MVRAIFARPTATDGDQTVVAFATEVDHAERMGLFRAQFVLQSFTNLARDRYTNTMHFVYDGLDAGDAGVAASFIRPAMEPFYDALGSSIPAYVSRTVTLNVYAMADPPPRVPDTSTFTIPASISTTSSTPPEVALVLGYRALPPHTGSRRNRIYLGPLNTTVIQASTATSYPTLLPAVATAFTAAARTAAITSRVAADPGTGWQVYSPKLGLTYAIDEFLMDHELDTQRRRGFRTELRTILEV